MVQVLFGEALVFIAIAAPFLWNLLLVYLYFSRLIILNIFLQ